MPAINNSSLSVSRIAAAAMDAARAADPAPVLALGTATEVGGTATRAAATGPAPGLGPGTGATADAIAAAPATAVTGTAAPGGTGTAWGTEAAATVAAAETAATAPVARRNGATRPARRWPAAAVCWETGLGRNRSSRRPPPQDRPLRRISPRPRRARRPQRHRSRLCRLRPVTRAAAGIPCPRSSSSSRRPSRS